MLDAGGECRGGMCLVLVPGLGTDARLFAAQRAALGVTVAVPRWVEPRGRESVPSYAARLAAQVRTGRPLVLGGASLGGMLALEMARWLRPRAVVLLASCRSGAALSRSYRAMGRVLQWLPGGLVRPAAVAMARVAGVMERVEPGAQAVYLRMLRESSPRLLRWAAEAVPRWRLSWDVDVPVHHLHGARDRVLPLAGVRPDVVLPGAGHLPTLTHAAAVNEMLAACVA